MRTVLNIAKADFKERVRSYRYVCVLIFIMLLCFLFIAPKNAGYITNYVKQDNVIYRGIYNSQWLGAMIALVISVFLSFFGFYLVRGNIKHDIMTGVNEILGSSSVKKTSYIAGKFISNLLVLITIVAACVSASIFVQVIRGESSSINIIAIVKPILFIVFPVICVTAASAVLFECVKFLRGSLGNVVYFLCYMAVYIVSMESLLKNNQNFMNRDFFGIGILINGMLNGIKSAYPSVKSNVIELFGEKHNEAMMYVTWNGMNFNLDILKTRVLFIAIAMLIIMISILCFRGFYEKSSKKDILSFMIKESKSIDNKLVKGSRVIKIAALKAKDFKYSIIDNVICEIKLILKDMNLIYIVVMALLFLVEIIMPIQKIDKYIMPVASIIPIGFIAKSSVKEKNNNMLQIMKSCEYYKKYWLISNAALIILDVIIQSGIIIKLLIGGKFIILLSFIAGIIFICSLASVLGLLFGSERLFEIIYILLWYFGVMNKIGYMDFTGFSAGGSMKIIFVYMTAGAILMAVSKFIRKYKEA